MGKKRRSNDPLTRALNEAPVAQKSGRAETVHPSAEHARPLDELLETLQAQTIDAMSGPFFDEGATTEKTPVKKRMRSETGTVHVSAKRRDPAVEATVTIDVRCDQDEAGNAGHYQLRARGHFTRETAGGDVDSEFPVSVDVRERDGALTLGADEMRNGIADAIRSTGKAQERAHVDGAPSHPAR
ncbi:MAG: hypothetical protein NVSMB19_07160 [Vulcanimicrobiaceae bacterium]